MVKDVAYGAVDMIVTGLDMLPERFFVIDYLQTIIAVEGKGGDTEDLLPAGALLLHAVFVSLCYCLFTCALALL